MALSTHTSLTCEVPYCFLEALQIRPACDRDAEHKCPQMKSALCHLASATGLTPLLDVAGCVKDVGNVVSTVLTVLDIVLVSTRKASLRDYYQAQQLKRELAQLPPADETRPYDDGLSTERRRSKSIARLYARAQEEVRRLESANQALQAKPLVLPASLSSKFFLSGRQHTGQQHCPPPTCCETLSTAGRASAWFHLRAKRSGRRSCLTHCLLMWRVGNRLRAADRAGRCGGPAARAA